jgi:hypothetical protein
MMERRLKRAEYAIVEIDDILSRMQSDLSRLTSDSLIESLKEQTLQLSHYVEQMLPVMVRILSLPPPRGTRDQRHIETYCLDGGSDRSFLLV